MPEKKATYRINESTLRKTLLGYSVEVDLSHCSAIEQEASVIRMQKSLTMPDTRKMVKYVALPLLLVASGLLVYSNIDSIQAAFTPKQAPAQVSTAKKLVVKAPVVHTPALTPHQNPSPSVENAMIVHKDPVIPVNKTPDTVKQQTAKQALPVVAGPPPDSAGPNKAEELAKASKPDTVSQNSEPPVKKKKKRRRRSNNIDDLKESTLQPNSADDDVVVPQ